MTDSAVASYFHKTLDIQRYFRAEFAFNPKVVVYIFSQFGYGLLVQIFYARVGVNARFRKNFTAGFKTDAVDIGEPYFDSLFSG